MKRRFVLPLLLTAFGFAFAQSGGAESGGAIPGAGPSQLGASAELTDAQGNVIGDVNLTSPAAGDAFVTVQVGLSPDAGLAPGEYALHVHQVGTCSPTFDAAGDHLNPEGAQHGLLNPSGPHVGDLPNVVVGQDGTTTYAVSTKLLTLEPGGSVFDDDGSAIILHVQGDDYITDPSGESGDPLACGVMQQESGN